MNNRCIIEQLGFNLSDKRVFIDCDDYIDINLGNNILVGANSDCTSIIVHTYNATMLDIDLDNFDSITFTIPISFESFDVTKQGYIYQTYDNYDVIFNLNENGMDEYWKEQNGRKKELLLHLEKNECSVDFILNNIIYVMSSNEDFPKNINVQKLLDIVGKAIKPMIDDYLKNNNIVLRKNITG